MRCELSQSCLVTFDPRPNPLSLSSIFSCHSTLRVGVGLISARCNTLNILSIKPSVKHRDLLSSGSYNSKFGETSHAGFCSVSPLTFSTEHCWAYHSENARQRRLFSLQSGRTVFLPTTALKTVHNAEIILTYNGKDEAPEPHN